MNNIEIFKEYWISLFGESEASMKCHEEVLAAYTSPDRHYHNLDHVVWMIDNIWNNDNSGILNRRERHILMIATIYHDVVYDAKKDDNEFLSATEFENHIWYMTKNGEKMYVLSSSMITSLIEFSNHQEQGYIKNDIYEPVINMFLDLDLMYGLDCPYDQFLKYSDNIRKEYSHLDDKEFSDGRKEFFKKLLDRKQILFYFTDSEARIRENIERYLKEN